MTRRQWLNMAAASLRAAQDDASSIPPHSPSSPVVTPCLVREDSPRRAVELLLLAALALDKLALVRDPDKELTPAEQQQASALLERRMRAEPMAYILGQREFYGRDFAVTAATLIPRPETECLVDTALQSLPECGVFFADLGCGSGCIGVTLAAERPHWRGIALDISADALAVARANADAHGVSERLTFVHGDMSDPAVWETLSARMAELAGFSGKFDLVVSNPPYISEAEYVGLEPDVRLFEPKSALVTGKEGLELPAAAVLAAQSLLRPGGVFLMEHGAGQGAATRGICGAAGSWENVTTAPDLAGLDRYLVAKRGEG